MPKQFILIRFVSMLGQIGTMYIRVDHIVAVTEWDGRTSITVRHTPEDQTIESTTSATEIMIRIEKALEVQF